jgi:NitT/TauT family transport system permease protein
MRSEPARTGPVDGARHGAAPANKPGGKAGRWAAVGLGERILGEGLVVVAILGWWLLSLRMPDYIIPDPWQVVKGIFKLFFDGDVVGDTLISTVRVIASVIIATALGWLLALIPQRLPVTGIIIHERIEPFLNSFPSVGWAILAVIWFGNSTPSVIFVQVAILTPFCLVNIAAGLEELDRELIEMGVSFTRSRRRVFFRITVPLLLPYVMAAVRIAYGVGWKIALVSELFGADSGLGFLMLEAQILSDAATVFATTFAIVLIFIAGEKLIINPLTRLAEHR